jgi:hypothetical protein
MRMKLSTRARNFPEEKLKLLAVIIASVHTPWSDDGFLRCRPQLFEALTQDVGVKE